MNYRQQGIHQLSFHQRISLNRTASTRDCVITMVKHGLSILHCFGAYKFWLTGHSVKSLHLGLRCPMTGYHQSCPSQHTPRTTNCICNSVDINEKMCTIMHLSTKQEVYDSGHMKLEVKYDLDEARKMKSELWKIANYSIKRVPNMKIGNSFVIGNMQSPLQIKVVH